MNAEASNPFGNDEVERKLYESLRFTIQAVMEGRDLTNEAERATMLFYLGEIGKEGWIRGINAPNAAYVVSQTLSLWHKENKDLLAQFKQKHKGLRSEWL